MSRKPFIGQPGTIWFDESKFIDADKIVRLAMKEHLEQLPDAWWRDDPLYFLPERQPRKYEPAPMPKDEDIDAVLAQIRRSKRA